MSADLENVGEMVERGVGEAVMCRSISLGQFAALGPLDLCSVVKVFERAWLPSDVASLPSTGYYHWVVGADTSCPAAISTYFDSLLRKTQPGSWYASGSYKIKSATFCLFNAFSGNDIRCEATFPGSLKAYEIDSKGNKKDVSEESWKQAYVCSVLRSLSALPKMQCISLFPVLPTVNAEKLFFELCGLFFLKANDLGISHFYGNDPILHNWLTVTVRSYFFDMGRYEQVISILQPFSKEHPVVNGWIALALQRGGAGAEARKLIESTIAQAGPLPSLLTSHAELLLNDGEPDQSLVVIREAVRLTPNEMRPWLLMARAYCKLKAWDTMLLILNEAPMRDVEDPTSDLGTPPFFRRTFPPIRPDPARIDLEKYEDKEASLFDNPPPPDEFASETFSGPWKEAFDLLVEATNAVGWDKILEIRANVFLMREDVEREQMVRAQQQAEIAARQKVAQAAADGEGGEEKKEENAAAVAAAEGGEEKKEGEEQQAQQDGEEKKEAAENEKKEEDNNAGSDDNNDKEEKDEAKAEDAAAAEEEKDNTEAPKEEDTKKEKEAAEEAAKPKEEKEQVKEEEQGGGEAAAAESNEEKKEEAEKGETQAAEEGEGEKRRASEQGEESQEQKEQQEEVEEEVQEEGGAAAAAGGGEAQTKQQQASSSSSSSSSQLRPGMTIGPDGRPRRKRVCKPWLDHVFHALYDDLRGFFEWLADDERFANLAPEDYTEEDVEERMVLGEEWVHRGDLARRLQQLADAERAYRSAAAMGNFVKAWKGLMDMYAEEGCAKETLAAAHEFLECFEGYKQWATHPPPQLQKAVHTLIAKQGLQAVRNAQAAIGEPHPMVNEAFHAAVRWHVHGYNR